jgi:hypothetical protein
VRRVCRLSNSPGILLTSNSGATYHRGTRLSLDQESCGDQSGVAGETRTACRLGHAHRGGLTGVQPHPATGPSVSPYSGPTAPGNKGPTAIPTAAVVLALFAQGALVQFWIGKHEVVQVSGVQPHHLLLCDALGLDHAWYAAPLAHDIDQFSQTP